MALEYFVLRHLVIATSLTLRNFILNLAMFYLNDLFVSYVSNSRTEVKNIFFYFLIVFRIFIKLALRQMLRIGLVISIVFRIFIPYRDVWSQDLFKIGIAVTRAEKCGKNIKLKLFSCGVVFI